MSFNIALSGKGGTGKTSLAGLLIRYLIRHGKSPIMVIDADANANLNEVLGVKVENTIGELREGLLGREGQQPGGMSKDAYFEMMLHQVVAEHEGFDLLVMGRPEGPGCYCFVNNLIRKYSDELSEKYPYIVTDNEAGLEHLSRRTTQNTDLLLVISDPSQRGIRTAKRVLDLADELKLNIKRTALIVNRVAGELDPALSDLIEEQGMKLAGWVPTDQNITEYDLRGEAMINLPDDSRAVIAFEKILDGMEIA
ncbi:MAG: carbon monoxide dehydrogenase [Nitrospirae bacterium CG_4_9_14_3_um_filter_53_35]|nr:MAG: carbon monoxide dehydrogenase [Nitrospirae bacterium CG2_30_53_67]PIS36348.1 MAG: carbon monoxide dehydrogenase [Nitrospirae bacterium CG08_land_8_20_14_0_20_52_24]PIV84751.1 MAG: carbon monoxide dehydrogenase [Nitrospirae bacterium CG17_big_fil_post_rev_8_21_14_2_50_50_9]PIW84815.1 MAG: carbon monoxide dehydrogenase [Nitrospirae bacterium CG_4_8_14_3_um_filter_50_41]PIX84864.1 MAG: carbon monoxide dehydrogenase [Nitrospirae bacterium CG_4_10_14_3_um_filter_53_41]PJA77525.1 MAG: carbon